MFTRGKVRPKTAAPPPKRQREVIPADEDDLDMEDDFAEEGLDEAPAPARRPSGPPQRKAAARPAARPAPVDDDEDEELVVDEDDDETDAENVVEEEPRAASTSFFHRDASKIEAGGNQLKFEKNEPIMVMFAKSQGYIYRRHYLGSGKGNGMLTCPGENCPLCDVGHHPGGTGAYYVFEVKGKKLEPAVIIEGSRFASKFQRQREKNQGKLVGIVYEITKVGKRKEDTDWEFEVKEQKRLLTPAQKELVRNPKIDIPKLIAPKSFKVLRSVAATLDTASGEDEEIL